jgi:hypothetical protein
VAVAIVATESEQLKKSAIFLKMLFLGFSKHVDLYFFIAFDIFNKLHYHFHSSVSCECFVKALNKASEIIFKWVKPMSHILFLIFFYSKMDASHPEILIFIHSHNSCRPSGDCGGSWDPTRDCCVAVWFTQSP